MTRREWIAEVVRDHERPLISYTARLLGDVESARDVVQDAFLKLWQADRERIGDYVVRWLYTVCRNRVVDIRRKEQRMKTADPQASPLVAQPTPAASPDHDDAPIDPVLRFIRALPERQQEVVHLRFHSGLSYREIGEVMDITANNVGVLLHTAIKALRQQLESVGEEVTQ